MHGKKVRTCALGNLWKVTERERETETRETRRQRNKERESKREREREREREKKKKYRERNRAQEMEVVEVPDPCGFPFEKQPNDPNRVEGALNQIVPRPKNNGLVPIQPPTPDRCSCLSFWVSLRNLPPKKRHQPPCAVLLLVSIQNLPPKKGAPSTKTHTHPAQHPWGLSASQRRPWPAAPAPLARLKRPVAAVVSRSHKPT